MFLYVSTYVSISSIHIFLDNIFLTRVCLLHTMKFISYLASQSDLNNGLYGGSMVDYGGDVYVVNERYPT